MINNSEIIKLLRATIDHNSKQADKEIKSATTDKEKTLIKAGFSEIIDGHFDLLKVFVFIDLVESRGINLEHINDLIDEHIKIIDEELDSAKNEASKKKINYNKKLWETTKTKLNAYLELLNPVE